MSSPFTGEETGAEERLSHLPKDTQVENGSAGVQVTYSDSKVCSLI